MRLTHTLRASLPFLAASALLAGCGGGGTTTPPPDDTQHLAGGGRSSSNDDFAGGPQDSGPNAFRGEDGSGGGDPAVMPEPMPGYFPVFYANISCGRAAETLVIRDNTAWEAWWTAATDCLHSDREGANTPPPPFADPSDPDGSEGSDGGVIEPDPWYDPYEVLPEVDFSQYAVVAITLEELEDNYGRSIWVQEIRTEGDDSIIAYEVSQPGDDCYDVYGDGFGKAEPGGDPTGAEGGDDGDSGGGSDPGEPTPPPDFEPQPSAPTIAVLAPLPLGTNVTFERTDTTWSCAPWEPDPNLPMTLYYTDAECNLGPNAGLITTQAAWEQWLDAAMDCDQARWSDWDGSMGGGEVPPGAEPAPDRGPEEPYGDDDPYNDPAMETDPAPVPPEWYGIDVDFSTHAVVVLRANPQTYWGGGIWLDELVVNETGTHIRYSEVAPGGDCPPSDVGVLQPTAAIRVPLPLTGPVSFERRYEQIGCEWSGGDDGTVTSPPSPGPPPSEPTEPGEAL